MTRAALVRRRRRDRRGDPRAVRAGRGTRARGRTRRLGCHAARSARARADRELDWEGRHFLVTPYLHDETLASQQRALGLFTRAFEECPQLNRKVFRAGIEQAQKYRDVLQRFGRFPHRNDALGRTSSAEELEFLKDWAQAAPPRSLDEDDGAADR